MSKELEKGTKVIVLNIEVDSDIQDMFFTEEMAKNIGSVVTISNKLNALDDFYTIENDDNYNAYHISWFDQITNASLSDAMKSIEFLKVEPRHGNNGELLKGGHYEYHLDKVIQAIQKAKSQEQELADMKKYRDGFFEKVSEIGKIEQELAEIKEKITFMLSQAKKDLEILNGSGCKTYHNRTAITARIKVLQALSGGK